MTISKSTYGEHYSTKRWFSGARYVKALNIDKDFCQANAIKYLARYGKEKEVVIEKTC